MRDFSVSVVVIATLFLGGCTEEPASSQLAAAGLEVPANGHATSPRLSGDNGNIVLSWLAPGENGTALHYSRLTNDEWGPAGTVVEGVEMFVNWADLPSVVPLGGDRLAAHWLAKRPGNVYSYDVVFSQSVDSGTTWSEPMSPHYDGTPTEHGFVSIFADGPRTGLLWLDGRKMANQEEQGNPAATGMTLRAGFVDAEQSLSSDQVVDELICDCCQTDVAVAASGPIAVYRNRTRDEIRDNFVTRFVDGVWQPGQPLGSDNWKFEACPVNGPSIVADDEFVAVAWFTAVDGPKVQVSTSSDSGMTFGAPVIVVEGNTMGRLGLASLNNGDIAVSWLQKDGDGSSVMVRRVGGDGSLGEVVTVGSDAAGFSVPQLARTGADLIFAWTESEDGERRVTSARLGIESL